MKTVQGMTVVEVIVVLAVILVLVAFLFPAVSCGPVPARKAQAKNDVVQLATAAIAFHTEYGRFPGTGLQIVNADLLAILTGSNLTLNPRKIVFIETEPYKKNKGGVKDGIFLDPWGAPYYIGFATSTNTNMFAGTNSVLINKRVASWNDPAQGPPPSWWQQEASVKAERARRYVTSWD